MDVMFKMAMHHDVQISFEVSMQINLCHIGFPLAPCSTMCGCCFKGEIQREPIHSPIVQDHPVPLTGKRT